MNAELQRLADHQARQAHWLRWGPYLSERQWGTVREDYSETGDAWSYFPHDHARFRAYRWGEDGIAGISDNHQRLCFALAFWNERDPFLKERLFGLTGPQGNHGEDVKEYYFYLDNCPSHAYMRYLYKYPQQAFPYSALVEQNGRRGYHDPEFELIDTGIFDDHAYFDLFVTYAKANPEDLLIRIEAVNRGSTPAPLHVLPTLWFRNIWSWDEGRIRPQLRQVPSGDAFALIEAEDRRAAADPFFPSLGKRWLYAQISSGYRNLLFTENETNSAALYHQANPSPYVKDAFHRYVIAQEQAAVNPDRMGSKAAAYYQLQVQPGECQTIQLRLADRPDIQDPFGGEFEQVVQARRQETDAFYQTFVPQGGGGDLQQIQRQAFAGLLWTKQYYHLVIEDWLRGDPAHPRPYRHKARNTEWQHLFNDDILSMPDKWEFPWYAAWDLAFHVLPLAMVDPAFAKRQMDRLTREWYMHPNGQMPAYEWHFSDVNPPVHAWGTWRVYQIEQEFYGHRDTDYLERVSQQPLLNFTWWVNRKDNNGNNVFQGGFLGLDNIGIFDRSSELPTGGYLEQSDGTSWMGMYCLNMLTIALELAKSNPAYEDIASKFFEHFLYIADAMNHLGDSVNLWDETDQFFYDVLHTPQNERHHLKVRSMVGLIPIFAVAVLESEIFDQFPGFKRRFDWFMGNRPKLRQCIHTLVQTSGQGAGGKTLLSIVNPDKLRLILQKMLDESEFFSPYGIRSLSRYHAEHPYTFYVGSQQHRVDYTPAESDNGMFGGNSNWRGPVWFPMNHLIVESLRQFHRYLGDDYKVECPTGSGRWMHLDQVADEISRRLIRIFQRDPHTHRRPVHGEYSLFQTDPHWRDLILFYEYFHGDRGCGLGASHQTGWTGLVATLIQQVGGRSHWPS
ncbi:MAG: hypothetical protein Q6M54_12770 [Thermostichus sp. DRC_bins_24]